MHLLSNNNLLVSIEFYRIQRPYYTSVNCKLTHYNLSGSSYLNKLAIPEIEMSLVRVMFL